MLYGNDQEIPSDDLRPPLAPEGELAGNLRLLVYAGLKLHRAENQPVLGQPVDQ